MTQVERATYHHQVLQPHLAVFTGDDDEMSDALRGRNPRIGRGSTILDISNTRYALYAIHHDVKRTQIYLSEAQWRDLSRTARIEETSVAELIRRAVDATYRTSRLSLDAVESWEALAGMWADRSEIVDSETHVRRLRDDDRLERLAGAETP